jgi:hypothetical protein
MVICHVACVCRFVLAWAWQCLFASTRSRWWYVDLPADETAKGRLCYDRGTQLDKWAIPNEILVDLIASGATKLAWSTERCHPSYTANLPKHVYSIFYLKGANVAGTFGPVSPRTGQDAAVIPCVMLVQQELSAPKQVIPFNLKCKLWIPRFHGLTWHANLGARSQIHASSQQRDSVVGMHGHHVLNFQ